MTELLAFASAHMTVTAIVTLAVVAFAVSFAYATFSAPRKNSRHFDSRNY